jgi:hypothetical protein
MTLRVFSLFVFLLSLCTCTETPVLIPDFEAPVSGKTVLIEDLTGVRCPNCPRGATALESISKKYIDKIIIIGIHGNLLTKPHTDSKYDFRSTKSIALEESLKPFLGKPSVQINRKFFEGETYTSIDQIDLWQSYVEKELARPQEMDIIITPKYTTNTRKLLLDITATPLIDEQGSYKISAYIIENNLIDPQETIGSIIKDYKHDHVLRDMLTDVKGDELGSKLVKNTSIKKSYEYLIPSSVIPANTEVVVMVSRANTNDKAIMQCAKVKIL